MDSDEGLKAVTGVLSNVPKIVAGYFMPKDAMSGRSGSGVRTTLAILASQELPEDGYPELRSEVVLDLASIPGTQELDVIVLNDASPLTRYDVVQHSQGIYCSSLTERVAFEASTIMDFLDSQMMKESLRRHGTNI